MMYDLTVVYITHLQQMSCMITTKALSIARHLRACVRWCPLWVPLWACTESGPLLGGGQGGKSKLE